MQDAIKFRTPGSAATGLASHEADDRSFAGRLDASILSEVLEEVDTGILICTEDGRVVLANDAGRRELQRGRPLSVDGEGWLKTAGEGDLVAAKCRSALRAAVRTQRRELLALTDDGQTLMVVVTPLRQRSSPLALMLLGRRKPAPELAIELLGKLRDLTHSERSVLVALVGGERVVSVARQRGVKITTVRTQVNALRAKLGAQRTEDLVRLAAGLPPVTGALRTPRLGLSGAAQFGR